MDKKRKTMIGIVIFVMFIAIAGSAYNYLSEGFNPDSALTESKKMPAPDFTVMDNDGNEVKLSDYFGKPIVLNFWASWCGPCQREMPHFNKAYGEFKDEVNFLMVDIGETTESAKSYIAENEFTLPIFFDTEQDAAKTYGITAIPKTYFIDKYGNITSSYEGALDEEKLHNRIELIR
jgi:thiol-disulfide isomerase/thioredoxin